MWQSAMFILQSEEVVLQPDLTTTVSSLLWMRCNFEAKSGEKVKRISVTLALRHSCCVS
uniref:Uncharacterized protein n=1 Tax=Arundo donax TaxID=35708 RepID=A0A0A9F2M1_ARUDO